MAQRRPTIVRAELDVDNASILVAGGGGVALDVTRKLKDMGAGVWQLQRTDVRRWAFLCCCCWQCCCCRGRCHHLLPLLFLQQAEVLL